MAVPCAADTCTVTHSTDGSGALLADAHIAQSVELAEQAVEPIDAAVGTTVALNRQRYRTRRRSVNAASPGFMSVDNVSVTYPNLVNPFACDAYALLTYEFRVRGERNDDAFSARGAADADFNDGETYDNAFYVRGYSQLDIGGLAGGSDVLEPESTAFAQRNAFDEYGLWVPQEKGIRDQATAGFNEGLDPTNTNGPRDKIWQQTVIMRLDPGEVFSVLAQIQVEEKWHFDMYSGQTDGNTTAAKGAQLRGGSILFWPADD